MGFGWFWAVFREACVGGLGGRYLSDMAFLHHSPSALGKHGQVAAFGSKDLRQPHPHRGGIFFCAECPAKTDNFCAHMEHWVTKCEKSCTSSMNPALFFTIGLYLRYFTIKPCKISSRWFRYVPICSDGSRPGGLRAWFDPADHSLGSRVALQGSALRIKGSRLGWS